MFGSGSYMVVVMVWPLWSSMNWWGLWPVVGVVRGDLVGAWHMYSCSHCCGVSWYHCSGVRPHHVMCGCVIS